MIDCAPIPLPPEATEPRVLARQLHAIKLLHAISTRFVQEGNTHSLFEQAVDAAIAISAADMGNIQILDEESGQLGALVRHSPGMRLPACCTRADTRQACCGMAMLQNERLVIEDLADNPRLANTPAGQMLLAAGVRALNAMPLHTRSGQLLGMLTTHCLEPRPWDETTLQLLDMLGRQIADIIDKIRMEKEINDRRNDMEALLKHQVAVHTAAAIAHELNQPLVAISAYSEAALRMLQKGGPASDKLTRALAGSVAQAQRAGRTLHDLLDFLQHGDAVLAPIDLNAAIQEAVALVAGDAYAGCQTRLELETGLPLVRGNRTQIQKVLLNLLDNAIQAMRTAGIVGAGLAIGVRTAAAAGMAQVAISDCGPGIAADMAERIFDPFFTTKAKGIGLGLAISRALIEAQGGKLWVEPAPGPGATFKFTLPYAE